MSEHDGDPTDRQERIAQLKAYMDNLRKSRRPVLDPDAESNESLESTTESMGRGLGPEAAGVHEAMYDGAAVPDLAAIESYEALIVPKFRPVLDITGDTLSEPSSPMWAMLDEQPARGRITGAAKSVGRIEVVGHPTLNYVGTAFVVGPDMILTNRHVAEYFVDGTGRGLGFRRGRTKVRIEFNREKGNNIRKRVGVREVVWVHPYWDAALLRLEPSDLPDPLTLDAGTHPDDLKGRTVVIIGYPAKDIRNDTKTQDELFRHTYGIKRAQPGEAKGLQETESFDRVVAALAHDASTLGGNSGSAVLDMSTGHVVGLHFGGSYLKMNHAVSTRELLRDDQITDDLAITGTPADPDESVRQRWFTMGARESASATPTATLSDSARATGATAATPPLPGVPNATEWYTNTDDAAIAEALERDPAATEALLRAALPDDEASEVIAALGPELTEGLLEAVAPDPNLPEILFLHGIMGSHLCDDLANGRRIWLDLRAFARCNIAESIRLKADGVTDEAPVLLRPSAHLGLSYRRAARRFRKARHVVHEISYDWRKPLDIAAGTLHHFIESRLLQRPDARFVIVAHSMGGLVAATYANRYETWRSRIDQAVVVGSPLGGSFAPLLAVQGDYPFFKTLAFMALWDSPKELEQASATLPGLLTMLPDPRLIPSAAACYESSNYKPDAKPAQLWLSQSLQNKGALRSSPLLAKTTAIVCGDIETVVDAHVVDGLVRGKIERADLGWGDGTVPLACSAIPEIETIYTVSGARHDGLLNNASVIKAVLRILHGEIPKLPKKGDDTTEAMPELKAGSFDEAVLKGDAAEALRGRVAEGRATVEDLRWLMDPVGEVPLG